MSKLYYSISEVAAEMNENISLVRYWSDQFPLFVKPDRNAKGNRMYRSDDIEALKQIQDLVKTQKMTLEGAKRQMMGNRSKVDKRIKAMESLKEIRSQLEEIKSSIQDL